MKVSIEWLKEYSDIDISAEELGDILTMTGSKVETVDTTGLDISNVVVGKILKIEKHPNADKLVVADVDIKTDKLQIVTGADNIKQNDIVPIAKDGAILPGGKTIKKGILRDIESCGMMCSCLELNIPMERYPNQIEDGIMILPKELENRLGEDIVDVLDLIEQVIDFEITPNRPDCLSVEGLGRETAVSLNKEFKNPRKNLDDLNIENKSDIEGLKVDITAPDLCYRYIARVVKNVKVGESPEWMKKRLNACGVRSINNIVDITNYVMLELGQPMHAFDINSIAGRHITVRRANKNEKITTLDEQERDLDEDMLVIADTEKAVAIAGVMGGLNSEIEENTSTVVFESAVFNGGSVRKTSKKVGLRTEASSRFEKGLSPENAERSINRAIELIELIGAGEAEKTKVDVYPTKQELKKVELDEEKINKLLGTKISREYMVEILKKLGMKIEGNTVTAPYYRTDIERSADLAEEVVRFYGYDKIDSTLISAETTLGIRTKSQKLSDRIRDGLVDKGLSEICTYGFIGSNEMTKAGISIDDERRNQVINIRNPLSDEFSVMRASTIPSMMQILSINNAKKNKEVGLFEISRTYKNTDKQIESGEVPVEENVVTIGIYGDNIDFYVMKGMVESVLNIASIDRYEVIAEKGNTSYHPGKTAKITIGKDCIAVFGEAHPVVCENYDIGSKVYIAELSLDKLTKYANLNKKHAEIPKYPAVERDIAMLVKEDVEVGQIEKIIYRNGKKILEEIELFDVYRNEKLGTDKKSVAYALKFRSKEKTLTDEEINVVMEGIVSELEKTLKAELRK